jgi:YD repeat-containing protein
VNFNLPVLPQFKFDAPAAFLQQSGSVTINYDYDPLYRLTSADYSTGDSYQYTYDAVGNRLTETAQYITNDYTYDSANRMTNVSGFRYTDYLWDANGNLVNDGNIVYTYDAANRLTAVTVINGGPSSVTEYAYNGLGDRLSQTVNGQVTNYTLDLNAGLTNRLFPR